METTVLSWQQVHEMGDALARRIEASGFKPDYLVGIAVGGLIPLALIAENLGMRDILTISANSYDGMQQGELNIRYLPVADLRGKKILLVDEIAETGETLKQLSSILRNHYQTGEVKTATLAINMTKCHFRPDFVVFEDDKWIVFPWEKDNPAS